MNTKRIIQKNIYSIVFLKILMVTQNPLLLIQFLGLLRPITLNNKKLILKKSFELKFAPQFDIQLEQTIREIQNLNYNEDESYYIFIVEHQIF